MHTRFCHPPRLPPLGRAQCTLTIFEKSQFETLTTAAPRLENSFNNTDNLVTSTHHTPTTQHGQEESGKRSQQERTWSRQACPLLQLFPLHTQGQGHQALHDPQHGRVSRHPYVYPGYLCPYAGFVWFRREILVAMRVETWRIATGYAWGNIKRKHG